MSTPAWLASSAAWLTSRRIRAQAVALAVCLWGVCAVDYATPGIFDRAGNIKFQDFLQFPVAANLIAQGRASELYNPQILTEALQSLAGPNTKVRLEYFYGPQVALPFLPITRFSFRTQAEIWVALSLLMYFGCVYLLWKRCEALRPFPGTIALCALAYPPLFHFFVRGQISAVILVCFTAAYLAFHAGHDLLAGIALGFLFIKPQFLVAIPLLLLLARSWSTLAGVLFSMLAQLGFTFAYFGQTVMRSYFGMLLHSAIQPRTTELRFSLIQMHSLQSFWALLIPSPQIVWPLYLFSSVAVIAISAAIWKSALPLSVRFAALTLASILANPHIYIYDLLALAPALLLLASFILSNPRHGYTSTLCLPLYLSFILPLFGPISRWTHLQLSVLAFSALLCAVWWLSRDMTRFGTPELATSESSVV